MSIMSNQLISIVMPVKNTSSYLEECLDSIVNQTYANWELLAVDDGSTDDSHSILEHYAQNDKRIKVFMNAGQGIIEALRIAYKNSSGEFITRMDSDDIMKASKLEVMSTQLNEIGKGHIALGLVSYFSKDGIGDGFKKYEDWLNQLSKAGNNFHEIYKECVIPSPCWMMYKSDFDMCGAFNSSVYPEDYELTFRFYANKIKPIPTQEVLHLWRDYSTRTSRTHPHYADSSFIELKVNSFLELDYDSKRNLVLWGAGSKGKFTADLLLKKEIPFTWICDNPKKIGKDIYGKIMHPFTKLNEIENAQSIITVANPDAQEEIKTYYKDRDLIAMKDYFFFC